MADSDSSVESLLFDSDELLDQANKGMEETVFVPTGNVGFDLALSDGRGLPLGSSTLLWASPGCGKTTIVADICLRLLRRYKIEGKPYRILYIDLEGSKSLLHSMGLKPYMESGDLIVLQGLFTWPQVEIIYNHILKGVDGWENIKVVVIDSISSVISESNAQKSLNSPEFGTKAKDRTVFYPKYLPLCKQQGISSFFISQVRQNMDPTYAGDKRKPAVSFADLHYVDVILKCGKKSGVGDTEKQVIKTVFGEIKKSRKFIVTLNSSGTDCKNRYVEGIPSEVLVEQGVCVHNWYAIRKLLEAYKLLKQGGGWYTFSKDLEKLGIPDNKLRKEEVNGIIDENSDKLIELLMRLGCYKLEIDESLAKNLKSTNNSGKSD